MNLLKRAWENKENIVKAFSDKAKGEIPTDPKNFPDWYAIRMDKCAKCKHNTNNMSDSDIDSSLLKFFKRRKLSNCNICGCFIPEKCWVPSEICAKHELGLEPEWGVIAIERNFNEDFLIEVKDPTINMFVGQNFGEFVFDIGSRNFEDKISFDFSVLSPNVIHIVQWGTGCGCIANFKPIDKIDGNHIDFHVDFKTKDTSPNGGEFRKGLNVRYFNNGDYEEFLKQGEGKIDLDDEKVNQRLHHISFVLKGNVIKEEG